MRVLVTGLSGFTGKYVQLALENKGYEVIGLGCNLTNKDDVCTEILNVKPNYVIHLAAISFVAHENSNRIYEINLIGTRNLLHAISQLKVSVNHILLVSSASIYGNCFEGAINEKIQPNPTNDYAVSKYAMELMVELWKKELPITVVRPFNYTGVGQDIQFLIPKIVAHFKLKKEFIELGNLDVWREFNDVRFVSETYVKLLLNSSVISNSPINICTGSCYSLNEILLICRKISGHTLDIRVNPDFVRKGEVKVLKGDNNLLTKIITSNNKYTIEDTLHWMLSS